MKKLYRELLTVAESDVRVAKILLHRKAIIHCMFYLSQAFEKANKSLLALIREKYLGESQDAIEEYLSKKIGHDKRKATKEVIEFLRREGKGNDFDQIKNELPRYIQSYSQFNSITAFHSNVNNDFKILDTFRNPPAPGSHYLHQKYEESKFYMYQILCYILRRYYSDVETSIRYPTPANSFTINNQFNQMSSKDTLHKLSVMTGELVNIVSSISNELSK